MCIYLIWQKKMGFDYNLFISRSLLFKDLKQLLLIIITRDSVQQNNLFHFIDFLTLLCFKSIQFDNLL